MMFERIVVKLGGSLLHQSTWVGRFRHWLDRRLPAKVLLIVGGGELVEGMRLLSSQHVLAEKAMHWRCVRALDMTWEIARELLPEAHAIDLANLPALDEFHQDRPYLALVRVASFYDESFHAGESQLRLPPQDWTTTTDAIAVLLGQKVQADRVILLKSCRIPDEITLLEATRQGIIDRALLQILSPGQTCELVQLAEHASHEN